jgi:hypothetical protein
MVKNNALASPSPLASTETWERYKLQKEKWDDFHKDLPDACTWIPSSQREKETEPQEDTKDAE